MSAQVVGGGTAPSLVGDAAPTRGPRYTVAPSGLLDGWSQIVDTVTGLTAYRGGNRRHFYRTEAEADLVAGRLNRNEARDVRRAARREASCG